MARQFRVYEKKRGNRRTGSSKLGSAGETVFFAVFLLLGCGGLAVMIATLIVPQWRVSHDFVEAECTVIDARLGQKETDEGALWRPEIQIEYTAGENTYRSWTYDLRGEYTAGKAPSEAVLARFPADPTARHACWYDPTDPNVAVLMRNSGWWAWLALIVPVSFILIGGGGLIFEVFGWGKSTERRADIARRASQIDLMEKNGRSKAEFPHVPDATNITNSPGTNLAFRLPAMASSTWALAFMLSACLVWNGTVGVFLAGAVKGHLAGNPDWLLTAFIVPFVVIGLWLAYFLVRRLLVTSAIGPTLVEISAQPLRPGESYRLFLSQTGRLKMKSIEALLVCEEEATFCHGTNTRTETMRIYEQQFYHRDAFEVRQGLPFEVQCEFEVPQGAMHSFKAGHNEVNWRVVVKGDVKGWRAYERSFPLVVQPRHNGSTSA